MVRRPFLLSSAVWRRRNVQRMEVYYRLILSTQTFVLFIVWSMCCLEQNYQIFLEVSQHYHSVSGVNRCQPDYQTGAIKKQTTTALVFGVFSSLSQMFDMR